MATYYVSSVAGNNTDGLSWANAKTTLLDGLALATASGDLVYVDSAHSETTTGNVSYDAPTADTHIAVISVNRNGSTTTGHAGWLAGAVVERTSFNSAINLGNTRNQTLFLYGITFRVTGNNGATINLVSAAPSGIPNVNLFLHTCTLSASGTGSNVFINLGAGAGAQTHWRQIRLMGCIYVVHDNVAGAAINLNNADIEMCGGSVQYGGANKPASLFAVGGSQSLYTQARILDLDLSGYEKTGGAYFDVARLVGIISVTNCKLSANPSLTTGTFPSNTGSLTLVNTDSGDTKNVFEYRNRLGTLTESTSVYADNGGQFDGSGISWQIVTTASCDEWEPFVTPWLHRWSEDTAQITAGLEIVHDSATDLTERTAWPEFEYLGNASFPLGTLASGRFATPFEGTATDWANSSDAWTGTGGFANANKQTLSATFTPAEKSLLRARLNVGVASKTLYLDPALRITGYDANPAVRWTRDGAFNAEPSGGGGGGSIFSSLIIRGVN